MNGSTIRWDAIFWIWLGKNPDYEQIYILWYFLSREEQDYFGEWLRYLVPRKESSHENVSKEQLTLNQDISVK